MKETVIAIVASDQNKAEWWGKKLARNVKPTGGGYAGDMEPNTSHRVTVKDASMNVTIFLPMWPGKASTGYVFNEVLVEPGVDQKSAWFDEHIRAKLVRPKEIPSNSE